MKKEKKKTEQRKTSESPFWHVQISNNTLKIQSFEKILGLRKRQQNSSAQPYSAVHALTHLGHSEKTRQSCGGKSPFTLCFSPATGGKGH